VSATFGGRSLRLCGICGFALNEPGEPCPHCTLIDEDVAAAIEGKRAVAEVERWLKQEQQPSPHPLEAELEKLQRTLEALEACPPLWWADELLWQGLRWFYRMRQWRVGEAWKSSTRG